MGQPINKKVVQKTTKKTVTKKRTATKRKHPEYGTSKLEQRFAKEFLEKLGIRYVYQFEAKDIKRFYDFYLPDANILIEVDGTYYHGYGKLHEEKNPMQKHNEFVDKIKDKWAAMHCIPLLRIWEHDINKKPGMVLELLKKEVGKYRTKYEKEQKKKERH